MSDLYDEDILLWSERQAALLRRLAAGERVNDPDLDWPHLDQLLDPTFDSQANPYRIRNE